MRDALEQLTTDQIRFIIARQECATDKDAAEATGISVRTVYNWPDTVKDAARLMAQDALMVAGHIRKKHLSKAMLVKVAGLDSDDERTRQNVSTEIIEWEMGRAQQTTKLEGTGEDGEIVVKATIYIPDNGRD